MGIKGQRNTDDARWRPEALICMSEKLSHHENNKKAQWPTFLSETVKMTISAPVNIDQKD